MAAPTLAELLKDAPNNWGRWGPDDELGCLNFLDAQEVLRGAAEIQHGKVFTLGTPITHPDGDPAFPGVGREDPQRRNSQDHSHYCSGEAKTLPGGLEFADDVIELGTHTSTHFDALGHTWFDGACWNGYASETTTGSMQKGSVLPIAEHGIVGRGVLLDVARLKGRPHLDRGEPFTHNDLLAAAERQGMTIELHDVVLIRTGALGHFYEVGPDEYLSLPFLETGLAYSEELVRWYQELELPIFATDTIAGEYTDWETTGYVAPLHASLMRNLGVLFSELMWLDDLAADCEADGRWTFFFGAAPLKIVGGTGALVNPLAIK